MIDTLLNLLFRCGHRRLTRPVSAAAKPGTHSETYVVCLDCGKQFAYDFTRMKIGKPLGAPQPDAPKRRSRTLKAAALATLPIAILIAATVRRKRAAALQKTDPR
jgi:DNA-directed RNA polymerase subunit RPC12/RpoP